MVRLVGKVNNLFSFHDFMLVNVSSIESPDHRAVVQGRSITLPCHVSPDAPASWLYTKSQDDPQYIISRAGNVVHKNFASKITLIENGSSGVHNLSLHNVGFNESGWYICLEDNNSSVMHAIQLTVHGKWIVNFHNLCYT